MEEKRTSRTVWIVIAVIVGALLLCSVSALAGGAVGYLIGARSQHPMMPRNEQDLDEWPRDGYEMPMPGMPRLPDMPDMPDMPERIEPFAGQSYGALITQIEPQSPADQAGLKLGDVVLAVDGQTLSAEIGLRDLLLDYRPGDRVDLIVLRDADRRLLTVELGQHPELPGRTAYLGVVYRSIPMGMQQRRRN